MLIGVGSGVKWRRENGDTSEYGGEEYIFQCTHWKTLEDVHLPPPPWKTLEDVYLPVPPLPWKTLTADPGRCTSSRRPWKMYIYQPLGRLWKMHIFQHPRSAPGDPGRCTSSRTPF